MVSPQIFLNKTILSCLVKRMESILCFIEEIEALEEMLFDFRFVGPKNNMIFTILSPPSILTLTIFSPPSVLAHHGP